MGVIQTISVAVTARTANFAKGMRRVRATLRKFRGQINKAARGIAKFGVALGAVALGGLTLLLKKEFALIDTTAKFADVIGLTTEQLGGWQLAAKITGVELGQLRTGLQRFQKNINDANVGLSTAKRAFAELGLDPRELELLSTNDALRVTAEAMGNLNTQAVRTGTVLDLFGRSGLALTKLLNTGAAGIDRFAKEAKKLNFAFNRVDASKVEAANDAVARLQFMFRGLVRTLAIELAPFIEAFSNQLIDLGISGEGMGARVAHAFEGVLVVFAKLVNFGNLLMGTFNLIRSAILKIAGTVAQALGTIINAHEKLRNAVTGLFGIDPTSVGRLTIDIGAAFSAEADAAFSMATKAIERFAGAADVDKITTFFAKVRDEASKAATLITGGGSSLAGQARASTRALGGFGAKAIDLENTFIGALNTSQKKEQLVHDPQLEEVTQILERIGRTLGPGGGVAVAG